MSPRKVHVIDDDDAVRDSLAFLLETSGYDVATYDSAQSFLQRGLTPADGTVITDVRMPGMTGIELLACLRERCLKLPVIVITGHGDVPLAVQAMKAGAADFIEKPFDDDAILKALDGLAGQAAMQDKADIRAEAARKLAALSVRERQVLDGLVLGKANKAVAQELGISPRTVEVYRANVMTKMQAASLSDLVRMALLVEATI